MHTHREAGLVCVCVCVSVCVCVMATHPLLARVTHTHTHTGWRTQQVNTSGVCVGQPVKTDSYASVAIAACMHVLSILHVHMRVFVGMSMFDNVHVCVCVCAHTGQ